MSRHYQMKVTIEGCDPRRIPEIKHAAAQEWSFSDDWEQGESGYLEGEAESYLCGGEDEEAFVERLSVAIWKANLAPCSIEVDAMFLENPPCESYLRDERDYQRLIGAEAVTQQ